MENDLKTHSFLAVIVKFVFVLYFFHIAVRTLFFCYSTSILNFPGEETYV